jgi:hypothetical protein
MILSVLRTQQPSMTNEAMVEHNSGPFLGI